MNLSKLDFSLIVQINTKNLSTNKKRQKEIHKLYIMVMNFW